ncbi:MAG: type IV toxin-antitoxin system AbiEi family antitoxin domain-containing protein [Bacteroidota bacterium]
MNYINFKQALQKFVVFSLTDIKKIFPDFDLRRLAEWQEKGYIKKIINRWYIFTDIDVKDQTLLWMANRIYSPSYISMEFALSYYGLIPEAVYTITSVSSRKTITFDTLFGTFAYRHLKPSLFFGYQIEEWEDFPVKLAQPEKVILDYLYLNPNLKTEKDWKALRLNLNQYQELIDSKNLGTYLNLFESKALEKRVSHFQKFIAIC